MRMPHTTGSAGRTLQQRRSSIDRKLRFAIEDDKNFFGLIGEVMADAALVLNDASMKKVQVGIERMWVEQAHVVELPRSTVYGFRRPVLGGVRMNDALSQGFARGHRQNDHHREAER